MEQTSITDEQRWRAVEGRDGSFEDVFQAVEYLLRADYVTGANIEVAGGYRL